MRTSIPISVILLLNFTLAFAQQFEVKSTGQTQFSNKEIRLIVHTVSEEFAQNYIEKPLTQKVNELLKKNLRSAYYDKKNPDALVAQLTQDIQSVIHDAHFNMHYFGNSANFNWVNQDDTEEEQEKIRMEMSTKASKTNFGLRELSILDGNVGYLNVASFNALATDAKEALASAMNFLKRTDALIIDMRENGGGQPEYVNLLLSYFFQEANQLICTYSFSNQTTQKEYRVLNEVEIGNQKYNPENKVYILTGPATGSGGEAFPYHMQSFKKATVVGEVTIGAANGFTPLLLDLRDGLGRLVMSIPDMKIEDYNTKTNWEKVGVIPDIAIPVEQALLQAHKVALVDLKSKTSNPESLENYDLILKRIAFSLKQDKTQSSDFEDYEGKYGGIRTILAENGVLKMQRDLGPKVRLEQLEQDLFLIDVAISPKPQVKFERTDGKIVGFYLINSAGEGTFQPKEN